MRLHDRAVRVGVMVITDQTVAIIGAGNIGRAIAGGLLRRSELDPSRILATRRSAAAVETLAEAFPGIRTGTNNVEAVKDASVVVLAVKPQNALEVIGEIRDHVPEHAMIVSVLAGVTTRGLETEFGKDLAVVRAMPNTPALVDESATVLAAGQFATEKHLAIAKQMFEAVGKVEVLPEEMMDAVTGLSGSGPAYIYMVIEALTDGGVKQGIPRPVALRLAAQTVFGAAKLAIETDKHPAILRDEVTTPGGTAIAAVAELEHHGLRTMLINAVATATSRSKELSRLNNRPPEGKT